MSKSTPRGIDRQGLDSAFEVEEILKSNLILEARLLAPQQPDDAADRFAQAAEIEERLSAACAAQGLPEKSWIHLFSAVSCWAQAGNFHAAIRLGDELLNHNDLSPQLRYRVQDFTNDLRKRRTQLTSSLALAGSPS